MKRKHLNGKTNNSNLKIYRVNGTRKEDKRERREKAVQSFLIVLIVILAIAAIFSAIRAFFPNWFGRFTLQGELAARVNGQPITMSQLDAEYARLPLQYQYFITKEAYLRGLIKNQLLIDKLLKQEVYDKVNVTTEMMLQYYNENSDTFKVPEMVTVRHILIGVDNRTEEEAKAKANTVMKELKADKSNFCGLVSLYSDDSGSLDTCGEYVFPRGQMVEEFEKVAFGQAIGNVSIVNTSFGYHIVWTINKTAEQLINFKDVQEQITLTLENHKQKMLYSDFIVKLREKAEIINYLEQREKELAEEAAKKAAEENQTEATGGAVQLVVEEPAEEKTGEKTGEKEPEIIVEPVEETKELAEEQEELEKEVEPAIEEVVKEEPAVTLGFADCLTSK